MAFINQVQFAEKCGITRSCVNIKIKRGQLVIRPDKKMDTEDPTNRNYINYCKKLKQDKIEKEKEDKKDQKESIKKVIKKQVKKQKTIKKGNTLSKKTGKKNEYQQTELDLSDLDSMEKFELEKEKLRVAIRKDMIKAEKERGQLIDRDVVFRAFAKLYEIDNSQFLQLSHKLTDKICRNVFKDDNEKKILKVRETIDDELYKIQKHIQREMNMFLKKIDAGSIQ